jgi:hypothetical protein
MFKLLPICHTKKHFIRIDKTQLELWGLVDEARTNDKWWYEDVFNLYSKRANIRPLRRYEDIQSPESMNTLCDLLVGDEKERLGPYIPGPSVQSNGYQIKVQVLSLRNVTPNLMKLFERGYFGIPSAPKIKTNVLEQNKGIFHLSACEKLALDIEDRDASAVDPGRKLVITSVDSTLKSVVSNRLDTASSVIPSYKCVENEDYHKRIGTHEFNEYEKKVRENHTEYNKSICEMQKATVKTTDQSRLTSYIKLRLKHESIREKVLFEKKRLQLHFKMYRNLQKTLAYYVKSLVNNRKKLVVFFGNGTFSPGGSGYAAVPKKKFLRELAQFAVVVLVNEYNTSKCCPNCFSELQDFDSDDSATEERLRVCPTMIEGSSCLKADRDAIGAYNILQKGVHVMFNKTLSAFEKPAFKKETQIQGS